MKLQLDVIASTTIKRRKPWQRAAWLGQSSESLVLLDGSRLSLLFVPSGKTKRAIPPLSGIQDSIISCTVTNNGAYMLGMLASNQVFVWCKDTDEVNTIGGIEVQLSSVDLAKIQIFASHDCTNLLVAADDQFYVWQRRCITNGEWWGVWTQVSPPRDAVLSGETDAAIDAVFYTDQNEATACLCSVVSTRNNQLHVTTLYLHFSHLDRPPTHHWATTQHPLDTTPPSSLISRYSHTSHVLAIALNHEDARQTRIVYVSPRHGSVVTVNPKLGGSSDSKIGSTYWVGDIAWTADDLFLLTTTNHGSVLMLTRLGEPVTLHTIGCSMDVGPSRHLPLHPGIQIIQSQDDYQQKFSVSTHPRLPIMLCSDGFIVTILQLPVDMTMTSIVKNHILESSKYVQYVKEQSNLQVSLAEAYRMPQNGRDWKSSQKVDAESKERIKKSVLSKLQATDLNSTSVSQLSESPVGVVHDCESGKIEFYEDSMHESSVEMSFNRVNNNLFKYLAKAETLLFTSWSLLCSYQGEVTDEFDGIANQTGQSIYKLIRCLLEIQTGEDSKIPVIFRRLLNALSFQHDNDCLLSVMVQLTQKTVKSMLACNNTPMIDALQNCYTLVSETVDALVKVYARSDNLRGAAAMEEHAVCRRMVPCWKVLYKCLLDHHKSVSTRKTNNREMDASRRLLAIIQTKLVQAGCRVKNQQKSPRAYENFNENSHTHNEERSLHSLLYSHLLNYHLDKAIDFIDSLIVQDMQETQQDCPCIRSTPVMKVVQTMARFMARYFTHQPIFIYPAHNANPLPLLNASAKQSDAHVIPVYQREIVIRVTELGLDNLWSCDRTLEYLLLSGCVREGAWFAHMVGDWRAALLLAVGCSQHQRIAQQLYHSGSTAGLTEDLEPKQILQTALSTIHTAAHHMESAEDQTQTISSLEHILHAAVMASVDMVPWLLDSLVSRLKVVCAELSTLVPAQFYLPAPPIYCPQPSKSKDSVIQSMEASKEETIRREASHITQLIIVVLQASHLTLPVASAFASAISLIQQKATQFKVTTEGPCETLPSDLVPFTAIESILQPHTKNRSVSSVLGAFRDLCSLLWLFHVRDQLCLLLRKRETLLKETDITGSQEENWLRLSETTLTWAVHLVTFAPYLNDTSSIYKVILSLVSELPPTERTADVLAEHFHHCDHVDPEVQEKLASIIREWRGVMTKPEDDGKSARVSFDSLRASVDSLDDPNNSLRKSVTFLQASPRGVSLSVYFEKQCHSVVRQMKKRSKCYGGFDEYTFADVNETVKPGLILIGSRPFETKGSFVDFMGTFYDVCFTKVLDAQKSVDPFIGPFRAGIRKVELDNVNDNVAFSYGEISVFCSPRTLQETPRDVNVKNQLSLLNAGGLFGNQSNNALSSVTDSPSDEVLNTQLSVSKMRDKIVKINVNEKYTQLRKLLIWFSLWRDKIHAVNFHDDEALSNKPKMRISVPVSLVVLALKHNEDTFTEQMETDYTTVILTEIPQNDKNYTANSRRNFSESDRNDREYASGRYTNNSTINSTGEFNTTNSTGQFNVTTNANQRQIKGAPYSTHQGYKTDKLRKPHYRTETSDLIHSQPLGTQSLESESLESELDQRNPMYQSASEPLEQHSQSADTVRSQLIDSQQLSANQPIGSIDQPDGHRPIDRLMQTQALDCTELQLDLTNEGDEMRLTAAYQTLLNENESNHAGPDDPEPNEHVYTSNSVATSMGQRSNGNGLVYDMSGYHQTWLEEGLSRSMMSLYSTYNADRSVSSTRESQPAPEIRLQHRSTSPDVRHKDRSTSPDIRLQNRSTSPDMRQQHRSTSPRHHRRPASPEMRQKHRSTSPARPSASHDGSHSRENGSRDESQTRERGSRMKSHGQEDEMSKMTEKLRSIMHEELSHFMQEQKDEKVQGPTNPRNKGQGKHSRGHRKSPEYTMSASDRSPVSDQSVILQTVLKELVELKLENQRAASERQAEKQNAIIYPKTVESSAQTRKISPTQVDGETNRVKYAQSSQKTNPLPSSSFPGMFQNSPPQPMPLLQPPPQASFFPRIPTPAWQQQYPPRPFNLSSHLNIPLLGFTPPMFNQQPQFRQPMFPQPSVSTQQTSTPQQTMHRTPQFNPSYSQQLGLHTQPTFLHTQPQTAHHHNPLLSLPTSPRPPINLLRLPQTSQTITNSGIPTVYGQLVPPQFLSVPENDNQEKMRHAILLQHKKVQEFYGKNLLTVAPRETRQRRRKHRRVPAREEDEISESEQIVSETKPKRSSTKKSPAKTPQKSPPKSPVRSPPKSPQRKPKVLDDIEREITEMNNAELNEGYAITPGTYAEYLPPPNQTVVSSAADGYIANLQYDAAMAMKAQLEKENKPKMVDAAVSAVESKDASVGTELDLRQRTSYKESDSKSKSTMSKESDSRSKSTMSAEQKSDGGSAIIPPDFFLNLRIIDSQTPAQAPESRGFLNVIDVNASQLLSDLHHQKPQTEDRISQPLPRDKLIDFLPMSDVLGAQPPQLPHAPVSGPELTDPRLRQPVKANTEGLDKLISELRSASTADKVTMNMFQLKPTFGMSEPERTVREFDTLMSDRQQQGQAKRDVADKLRNMEHQIDTIDILRDSMERDLSHTREMIDRVESLTATTSVDRPDDLQWLDAKQQAFVPRTSIDQTVRKSRDTPTPIPSDGTPKRSTRHSIQTDANMTQSAAVVDSRISGISGISDIIGDLLLDGGIDPQMAGLSARQTDALTARAHKRSAEQHIMEQSMDKLGQMVDDSRMNRHVPPEKKALHKWMLRKRAQQAEEYKQKRSELREMELQPFRTRQGRPKNILKWKERKDTERQEMAMDHRHQRFVEASTLISGMISDKGPVTSSATSVAPTPKSSRTKQTVQSDRRSVKSGGKRSSVVSGFIPSSRRSSVPASTVSKSTIRGKKPQRTTLRKATSEMTGARNRMEMTGMPDYNEITSVSQEMLVTSHDAGDHQDNRLMDAWRQVEIAEAGLMDTIQEGGTTDTSHSKAGDVQTKPYQPRPYTDFVKTQRPSVTRSKPTFDDDLSDEEEEIVASAESEKRKLYSAKKIPGAEKSITPKAKTSPTSTKRPLKNYTQRLSEMKKTGRVYTTPITQRSGSLASERPSGLRIVPKSGKKVPPHSPKTYSQQLQSMGGVVQTHRAVKKAFVRPQVGIKATGPAHKPTTYTQMLKQLNPSPKHSNRKLTKGASRVKGQARSRPYIDPFDQQEEDIGEFPHEWDSNSILSSWSVDEEVQRMIYEPPPAKAGRRSPSIQSDYYDAVMVAPPLHQIGDTDDESLIDWDIIDSMVADAEQ